MVYVLRLEKDGNKISDIIAGPLTQHQADAAYQSFLDENGGCHDDFDPVTLPAEIVERIIAAEATAK